VEAPRPQAGAGPLPFAETGWRILAGTPTFVGMKEDAHHHLFDTAIGTCGVAWNDRGLCGVQLPEKNLAATEQRLAKRSGSSGPADPPPQIEALIADIRHYLAGEKVDFSAVPVDLDGIEGLRRRIYEALRQIGFGRTVTYGELAKTLGSSDWEGARDVGEAMGKNPMPIVIPCHRVLAAGGKLGGFSAYGGTTTKQKLLALEGVRFDGGAPRLPGL
jgi:methylated-DNA-[protein]-cysteine S-methyltransferase